MDGLDGVQRFLAQTAAQTNAIAAFVAQTAAVFAAVPRFSAQDQRDFDELCALRDRAHARARRRSRITKIFDTRIRDARGGLASLVDRLRAIVAGHVRLELIDQPDESVLGHTRRARDVDDISARSPRGHSAAAVPGLPSPPPFLPVP